MHGITRCQNMNTTTRTIGIYLGLGLFAGLLFWIVDSFASFFFYKSILRQMIFDMPDSLLDSFIFSITPSSLLARVTFLIFSISAGFVVAFVRLKQKASDASRRESEERMRALLNSIDDLHGMISPGGSLLFMNSALRSSFSIPFGNSIGTPFISYLDESLQENMLAAIDETYQTQKSLYFEGNNQGSWYDITLYPVYGEKRDVTSIGFFAHDITSKKHVEEELKENETRYQELFNSIPSGFLLCEVIIDASNNPQNYRIIDCNPSFEQIMEQPLSTLKNQLLTDLIPLLSDEIIEQFHAIIKRGHPGTFSLYSPFLKRHLEMFIFQTPKKYQYGAIITDTTDLHRLIMEQRESLQQINKNLEELAILNDGIRNPLAIILALIEVREYQNPEGIIEQVQLIDQIVTRLDQRWLESDKVRNFLIKHYAYDDA